MSFCYVFEEIIVVSENDYLIYKGLSKSNGIGLIFWYLMILIDKLTFSENMDLNQVHVLMSIKRNYIRLIFKQFKGFKLTGIEIHFLN